MKSLQSNRLLRSRAGWLSALAAVALGTAACSTAAPPAPPPTTQAAAPAASAALAASPAAAPSSAPLAILPAVPSAIASPLASAVAASPVQITGIVPTPNDVAVTLRNNGTAPVDASSWSVRVGSASASLPAGTTIPPGQSITLHTAAGTSTSTDVYLGQAAALLSAVAPGVIVQLVNGQGTVVNELTIPAI